jgi:hypothetical protein
MVPIVYTASFVYAGVTLLQTETEQHNLKLSIFPHKLL